MPRRPTYTALYPLRLNVSLKQDEFLRTMATQLGIGKAEFLRRLLADVIVSWIQAGRYVPPASEQGRQESRAVPREHNSHI